MPFYSIVTRLVLDGVFHREEGSARPVFRAARRLSEGDLDDVLQAVRVRILGLLRRRGLLPGEPSSALEDLAESSPTLAGVVRRETLAPLKVPSV